MALLEKLVKISNYTGLYLQDSNCVFLNQKEISTNDIQKKIKPPYTICVRYYEGKKSVYDQYPITNNTKTVKKICDEISAQRKIKQIEKTFKAKDTSRTLNQIFDEYIEYKKNSISEDHYTGTKYSYNAHIKEEIGDLKINNITTKKIQNIVNNLLIKGKAPRTVKTVKDILSPVFEYGIKNDYCEINPAKDVEIPKFDNQRYFTIEDENAQKLYNIIINYQNPTIKGIFIFLLHGRRKGEVLNLKWENINISQKLYYLEDWQNKSRRKQAFPLSELQIQVLDEIGIKKSGYIFLKEDGEPYKDIRHHWNIITKELEVKIRLHDLRHLIGFIAVNEGVSLAAISKTLGHSNMQITERYSNVKIQAVKETLDKVFDVFDENKIKKNDKLEKLKTLFPDKSEDELQKVIDILK
ncbi:MAG: site-specific integrase [Campylobacterales bacterium]|nr:site-specific integrase [Campylobacterales bacterium]